MSDMPKRLWIVGRTKREYDYEVTDYDGFDEDEPGATEYVLASRLAEVERERDEARNALLKAVFGDTERAEHLAQLVEKMKAERDAERARAERWKAVALEWLRVMSAWRSVYPHMGATEAVNAHNEALAAESAATERKT